MLIHPCNVYASKPNIIYCKSGINWIIHYLPNQITARNRLGIFVRTASTMQVFLVPTIYVLRSICKKIPLFFNFTVPAIRPRFCMDVLMYCDNMRSSTVHRAKCKTQNMLSRDLQLSLPDSLQLPRGNDSGRNLFILNLFQPSCLASLYKEMFLPSLYVEIVSVLYDY